MINTEDGELHRKAIIIMTDGAMLQILRRTFRNAVTFCAFETILDPTEAEKRRRGQQSLYERT
jgi:hypothetical protein